MNTPETPTLTSETAGAPPSAAEPSGTETLQISGFFSPNWVVEQLTAVRDRQPMAALALANQHRESLTDVFLKALEDGVANPRQDFASHGMLFNYASYFLARWRDPRALPLFIRWFSLPDDEAIELGGDTLTQAGARFLASACSGNVGPIKELVQNRQAHPVCRGQGLLALGVLAAWGELAQPDLESYLLFLAREGLERQAGQPWNQLAFVSIGLEVKAVFPELRRACEEGLIPPSFMTPQRLSEIEQAEPGRWTKIFRDNHPPIIDVARETAWWAGFHANTEAQPAQGRSLVAGETYVAPKKVGRNDPCPCGSGQKYKKCCGR